jgi:hypothetical protein
VSHRWIGSTAAVLICCATTATATAQELRQSQPRAVGVTAAFGVNVLLGGLTAATRAWIEGHNPARAFAIGAIGGAVHFSAKLVGPGASIVGPALGATGTSIVVNAGRGVGPLDELYVPVGPLRLRFAPRGPRDVRVAVNAHDAIVLVQGLAREGLVMDWGRTASSGTFVLRTENRQLWSNDQEVGGVALGSVIVLSDFYADPPEILDHEVVHAHQYWFADEAIGRPLEGYLRKRIPLVRRLPHWLELGLVTYSFAVAEVLIFGRDGPAHRLVESEAYMLTRR